MPKNSAQGEPALEKAPARRDVWRSVLPAVGLLLALVNVLFFALALKPAGARGREQREALQRLLDERRARSANGARLREILSRLDAASQEDAAFYREKFLSRSDGFSIIIDSLDKLAKANNVHKSTVSYKLSALPGRPDLDEVEISTGVEGDYKNVVEFINQVERDRLFLVIDSIGVAADRPLGQTGPGQAAPAPPRTVRLSILLATFFRL
jgi:hypothetical protein